MDGTGRKNYSTEFKKKVAIATILSAVMVLQRSKCLKQAIKQISSFCWHVGSFYNICFQVI